MCEGSILRFSTERGFGETHWVICPSCWNAMKHTSWEDGSEEEICLACERMAYVMGSAE